ncbi:MAG TPA: YlxM family DNA-binding protein [Syntrophomonadaceae bacterium]|nr:YlxM family DNA-binding protein [Syntrophomonadaceae bacterium]
MLDKVERIVLLNDFYGPLLTAKQRDVMHLYYENDWSLAEIAQSMDISRQAVYDLLHRASGALEDYETRLGLMGKFLTSRVRWQEIYDLLENGIDHERVQRVLELIKELNESL